MRILAIVFVLFLSACSEKDQSTVEYRHTEIVLPSAASGVTAVSAVAAASSVLAISGVQVSDSAPDEATVIKWAELDADAKIEKILPVQLSGGEKAYIAKIERFQGRNDMYGAYLIRPALGDANEIGGSVQDIDPVPTNSADLGRFVVIKTGGSGQGDSGYGLSLVYFKDWEKVEIHKIDYLDSGACFNYPDSGTPCSQNEVNWIYKTENNDLILEESIAKAEWKVQPADCKVSANKTVTKYRIKDFSLTTELTEKSTTMLDVPCFHAHKKS